LAVRGLNINHNHDLKNIFKGAATRAASPSFAGFIAGDGFPVLLTLWFESESPQAR